VQAWYQGGVSVVDFTDSANPVEIAYFDRGPIDPENLVTGGYWSTYWYRGKIYGTEIVRGLDVFRLTPSAYLSEPEIVAAALGDQGSAFNPQQQFVVSWPAEPAVAKAYLGQLERGGALPKEMVSELAAALQLSASRLEEGVSSEGLAARLDGLAGKLKAGGAGDTRRMALAQTLTGLSARLR
jgi:hypothetical protein